MNVLTRVLRIDISVFAGNMLPDASCVVRLYSGAETSVRLVVNGKASRKDVNFGAPPQPEVRDTGGSSHIELPRFPDTGSVPMYPPASSPMHVQDGHSNRDLGQLFNIGHSNLSLGQNEGLSFVGTEHYDGDAHNRGIGYGGGSNVSTSIGLAHDATTGIGRGQIAAGNAPGYSLFGSNVVEGGNVTGGLSELRHGYLMAPNQMTGGEGPRPAMDASEPVLGMHQGEDLHSIGYTGMLGGPFGTSEQSMGYGVGNNMDWPMIQSAVNTDTLLGRQVYGIGPGIVLNHGARGVRPQMYGDWNGFKGMLGLSAPIDMTAATTSPAMATALESTTGCNSPTHGQESAIASASAGVGTSTNTGVGVSVGMGVGMDMDMGVDVGVDVDVDDDEKVTVQALGRKKRARGAGRVKRGGRLNRVGTSGFQTMAMEAMSVDMTATEDDQTESTQANGGMQQTPWDVLSTQAALRRQRGQPGL